MVDLDVSAAPGPPPSGAADVGSQLVTAAPTGHGVSASDYGDYATPPYDEPGSGKHM